MHCRDELPVCLPTRPDDGTMEARLKLWGHHAHGMLTGLDSLYWLTDFQAGGLLCNSDGTTSKPFPSKPYCMTGGTNIGVVDKTGKGCSWCQTVLPGNEAMLIPTWVDADGSATLAMPNTNYWQGTSAQCDSPLYLTCAYLANKT